MTSTKNDQPITQITAYPAVLVIEATLMVAKTGGMGKIDGIQYTQALSDLYH